MDFVIIVAILFQVLVFFKMLSTGKYNYQQKFAFLLLYQVLVYIDL